MASKIRDESERDLVARLAEEVGAAVIAHLPYDEGARPADRDGRPVIEAVPEGPFVRAVEKLAEPLMTVG